MNGDIENINMIKCGIGIEIEIERGIGPGPDGSTKSNEKSSPSPWLASARVSGTEEEESTVGSDGDSPVGVPPSSSSPSADSGVVSAVISVLPLFSTSPLDEALEASFPSASPSP